jgi:hypothetical protein
MILPLLIFVFFCSSNANYIEFRYDFIEDESGGLVQAFVKGRYLATDILFFE